MPMLIFALFAVLLIALFAGQPLMERMRRRRLMARPFPAAWRNILRRRVPLVACLPANVQRQLKQHIQVFIAEKPFIGCGGQRITDEVRVTIAAQACLLLLNRADHYFPSLRQVLVYPDSFVATRGHTDGMGIVHHGHAVLAGESWEQGQVVLSWQDVLAGAATHDDGHNVVIHEFAHQHDQESGGANGAPPLADRRDYRRWSQVFNFEYAALQTCVERGEESLLDPYGATSPAEFFAVATEVFFERPRDLERQHSALYEELAVFYRVNPAGW